MVDRLYTRHSSFGVNFYDLRQYRHRSNCYVGVRRVKFNLIHIEFIHLNVHGGSGKLTVSYISDNSCFIPI